MSGVSFTVKNGEIFGLLGPNGAGKSTIIKILHGDTSPTSGTVTLFGRNIVTRTAEARLLCGVLADPHSAYELLSPMQNMRLMPGYADLGIEKVNEALDLVELNGSRNTPLMKMKRTDRQRYRIASAMLSDPKALILDEPGAGMSDTGVAWLKSFLLAQRSAGKTIIMTASSPYALDGICDRIGILSGGKLVVCGKADAALEEYCKAYVYPANGEEPKACDKKKHKRCAPISA